MKKMLLICLPVAICAGGFVRAQSSGEDGWFDKKVLVEEFSSSTCTPCAQWNTKAFNPVFEKLGTKVALVKYQMNFPGSGDPYYTAEGGRRKNYYSVEAAPTMAIDGEVVTPLNTSLMSEEAFMEYMRERLEKAGQKTPFNIAFEQLSMDCGNKQLTVAYRVETKAELTGARLHTVVVERETSGNKSINRETSFHHVMMAMQPGGNGLSVNLKADTVYRFTYTVNMTNTHMEECDDLMVVCFIQGADKAVAQSAIEGVRMLANESIESHAALSLYPNPASESVTLQGLDNATVELFDLSGRLQFTASGLNGDYPLDVRACKPGLYLVKVRETAKVSTARLNIVR